MTNADHTQTQVARLFDLLKETLPHETTKMHLQITGVDGYWNPVEYTLSNSEGRSCVVKDYGKSDLDGHRYSYGAYKELPLMSLDEAYAEVMTNAKFRKDDKEYDATATFTISVVPSAASELTNAFIERMLDREAIRFIGVMHGDNFYSFSGQEGVLAPLESRATPEEDFEHLREIGTGHDVTHVLTFSEEGSFSDTAMKMGEEETEALAQILYDNDEVELASDLVEALFDYALAEDEEGDEFDRLVRLRGRALLRKHELGLA